MMSALRPGKRLGFLTSALLLALFMGRYTLNAAWGALPTGTGMEDSEPLASILDAGDDCIQLDNGQAKIRIRLGQVNGVGPGMDIPGGPLTVKVNGYAVQGTYGMDGGFPTWTGLVPLTTAVPRGPVKPYPNKNALEISALPKREDPIGELTYLRAAGDDLKQSVP